MKEKEEDINTGILPQCYVLGVQCKERKEFKIPQGEHKDKLVYICFEGCTKQDNDCPKNRQMK